MQKTKNYYGVRFPVETLVNAYKLFISKHEEKEIEKANFSITKADEDWKYDSFEEFLAEYPKADSYGFTQFAYRHTGGSLDQRFLTVSGYKKEARISVQFPSRPDIESIFNTFEKDLDKSVIKVESKQPTPKSPIKIFIGHGHDNQWKDLKDHLHEQHRLDVTAYEIGPRAGLTVKEVLETMLNESSIAFLVFTGEDVDNVGGLHARENVIHELGLFQGRSGWKRAIILLERGVEEFSNISGVTQIRFNKGNIRETFGDVIATIKREFE